MDNPWNNTRDDVMKIEGLTPQQLDAIRNNIQDDSLSDDEVRGAMMQAVADGYEVEDFLG